MSADPDRRLLRTAIEEARRAKASGNPPFGAVLATEEGDALVRAANTEERTGDCTGHAEMNLIRTASPRHDADTLSTCTLYASTEPCPMCAGAIFWSEIGRVVFGLRAERHYDMKGNAGRQLLLSCEEVLNRGNHDVEVVGPLLEDEAAAVFDASTA